MGKSAGSAKGKPKIEVYDKDRKKGAGALITPAKVWDAFSFGLIVSDLLPVIDFSFCRFTTLLPILLLDTLRMRRR